MTTGSLLSILVVWLLAIASPGPDLVQLLRVGAVRRNGVACALGIMSGNLLWIVASMLGLSALVDNVSGILTALFLVGGCVLAWMGQGALRGGLAARKQDAVPSDAASSLLTTQMTTVQSWRLGLVTNLSNPKALVFFGAVFAGFVPPDTSWAMRAVVLVMMMVIGVAWFVFVAVAVSVPALSTRLQAAGAWIDIVAGTVFLVLAAVLVIEGIARLL
ncbi:LysE family translocator [Corynebacterium variabile]|uniref:LysE family translocator n=2 Tax=Corynebacterium variabile TaxID=1727 RepID=UPI00264719AB|nr:LysE family translocator [Corynebacterium variabile]MDN6477992.1 LysE family translocator [Corynebacterium variabile]